MEKEVIVSTLSPLTSYKNANSIYTGNNHTLSNDGGSGGYYYYSNLTLASASTIDSNNICILFSLVVSSFLIGVICVIGVIGNLLAFIVFQIDTLKTSTTFLFQGLSLTDSVLLTIAFPLYCIEPFANYHADGWYFNYTKFVQAYMYVYVHPWVMFLQTATIYMTVLVAVNRYIAVCIPYKAPRLCSVSKAKKYLAIVILLSFAYNFPRYFASRVKSHYFLNTTHVIFNEAKHTPFGETYFYSFVYKNILYSIFLLLLPLFILTILNIILIATLRKLKAKRAVMQTRAQQQDNNVTFVLILVILLFMFCQTPALINQILWFVLKEEARLCNTFHFYYSKICNLLVLFNSAGNFIIYFMFNSRFKQVMVQRLCGGETQCEKARRRASANGTTQYSQTLLTKV